MSAPRSPASACGHKRLYVTYSGAESAARGTTKSNIERGTANPDVHPYACPNGEHYHVGRRGKNEAEL